ncbi:MAG: cytochrome c3 family protein [Eggerthellaceae bacterium]|nr:cytochrome c3 family protein [Eggerthellaceae bacterium]
MSDEIKNGGTHAAPQAPEKAPRKKKAGIVVVVVVAILAVAGIGGWIWHETPGFCGTMCHDTMGEHLANYEGTDATQGAGLARVHAVQDGTTCLGCHEADFDSQVAELKAQLSGNYGDLTLAGRYYSDNDKCLSCHEGSYDALAELTSDLDPYNPHKQPHGQMNCNECHKGHAAQVDVCAQCHDNGGQEMKA